MKNYTITVNGTAYNVSVEEGTSAAPAAAPVAAAPAPAGIFKAPRQIDHQTQIALDERLLGALASRSKLPQQRLLRLPHRLLPLIPQSPAL